MQMTVIESTIERFQRVQVELVRAGFATEFLARPNWRNREEATLTMFVDLKDHKAEQIEELDALATQHGFSYTMQDDSRAALVLADDRGSH
jgi:hypothetical protein